MPQYPATIALSALNGTNGFALPGLQSGDRTGNAVSAAGDVNGDGFDDFIVAASSSSIAASAAGLAYVVFGKSTAFDASFDFALLDGSNGFRIDPVAAGDDMGTSVAAAGDLNGDGFGDIIVGAGRADPNAKTDAGSAYVIYGQAAFTAPTIAVSGLDGSNGVTIIGIDAGDLAGTAVGGGGDFNGDGLDDLLIGAPAANGGQGESYVIFGNNTFGLPPTGDPSTITGAGGNFAGVILAGGSAPSSGGTALDFIGDINGDGFDDVIFGAPDTEANGLGSSGSSYVVFGSNSFSGASILPGDLNGTNGFRIDGVNPFDDTGFSVASAGDFNADGIADMIIGAPGSATGKAYVVFGRSTPYASVLDLTTLPANQGFVITGLSAFDLFGESVASAGDVNGDGYDDIIVGARAVTTPGGNLSGESYVIFGKASGFGTTFDPVMLDGTNGFRIQGAAASDRSGKSVASAGDINGDGLDDLVIGANQAGGGGVRGAAYVVLGQLSDTAVTLTGTQADQTLVGSNFADQLSGAAGDDELWGHAGADQLEGGAGNDIMRGGDDNDEYYVDSALDQVIETVSGGTDDRIISFNVNVNLANHANVEILTLGGGLALNGTGNALANILSGNSAANTLNGGLGADDMSGLLGNDTYFVDNLGDIVREAAGSANGTQDTVLSMVNFRLDTTTTARGVEHLVAQGTSNVTFVGSSTYNIITGNTGNNYLAGYGGNDTISGGVGNDTVFGGDGKDTLTGGAGNDNFLFSFVADSGGTQPRRDVITDFSQVSGNNDWIDLALTDANGALSGNQAFTFIGTAAFTGAAGELRYFQDVANNRTIIEGNVRVDAGSPGPEFSIELTGLKTLNAGINNTFDIIL